MPPMTTGAKGRCTSAPVPTLSAIGTKPKAAINAVISTGRRRASAPSRTAFSTEAPSLRNLLMKVIITKPLSTATPESAIKPTPAEIEKGISRANEIWITRFGHPLCRESTCRRVSGCPRLAWSMRCWAAALAKISPLLLLRTKPGWSHDFAHDLGRVFVLSAPRAGARRVRRQVDSRAA